MGLEEAFGDAVEQAALLAPLALGEKSGFLRSRPGLQPLSAGAGEKICSIDVSASSLCAPRGLELRTHLDVF